MKSNQNSFSLGEQLYTFKKRWNLSPNQNQSASFDPLFSVSPSRNIFVVNTNPGIAVSENYQESSGILELSTGGMHITSMQLSPSQLSEAIISFTNGMILRMNVLSRNRSKLTWVNAIRGMYSNKQPSQVRWVSESSLSLIHI